MSFLVSAVALAVSALTIAQGYRALSASTRLRDQIGKDLAIRKELDAGELRDELTSSIEEATVQLVVTEKHPARWWVLPNVVVATSTSTGLSVWVWTIAGPPPWYVWVEFVALYVAAVWSLYRERRRLRLLRRPLAQRLRAKGTDQLPVPAA
jgi:hypothetical protein